MGRALLIITGASGALGSALYFENSKSELTIGLTNSRSLAESENGQNVRLDITDETKIREFIQGYSAILSRITVVHLAGISIDGPVYKYKADNFIETLQVNVAANFLLTKHLLPLMVKERWGRIISVSSIVGRNGAVGAAAYSSSKTALHGLTKSIAKEYGRYNITSNLIELGYFTGGMQESVGKAQMDKIFSSIPSGKLGSPEELKLLIDYIRASEYLNGAVISLDGGL